jgi:hypothetical protein
VSRWVRSCRVTLQRKIRAHGHGCTLTIDESDKISYEKIGIMSITGMGLLSWEDEVGAKGHIYAASNNI